MSLAFTLKRTVPVRRFDLVATIACEEIRNELKPILAWATACAARDVGLDPAALASELLGPGAGMVTVAKRLLLICRNLRLISDDMTRLTDDGVRAAQTGNVLQPEKGEWTIWACEDPLLDFPIVGIAPRSPNANGNDREPQRDRSRQKAEPMPGWVLSAQNQSAALLADGRVARFDHIEAPATESSTDDELQLFWTPNGSPEVHAVGVISPKSRIDQPLVVVDLPSRDRVWTELLHTRRLVQRWDSQRMALRIPFKAATTDDERTNMRTSLIFKSPSIDRYGEFRDLTVSDIQLCPDSDQSASEWAKHLIVSQLGGTQTQRVFAALTGRVRARFDGWSIQTPSREALARELAATTTGHPRTRAYWALQSALDWNL